MEAKLETGETPKEFEINVSIIPIRKDEKAGVLLYEFRMDNKVTEYQICDAIHNEVLNFPADQREEAIETYEQMETRKI